MQDELDGVACFLGASYPVLDNSTDARRALVSRLHRRSGSSDQACGGDVPGRPSALVAASTLPTRIWIPALRVSQGFLYMLMLTKGRYRHSNLNTESVASHLTTSFHVHHSGYSLRGCLLVGACSAPSFFRLTTRSFPANTAPSGR